MAITSSATAAPTAPPTIAPVFDLPLPEDDAVGGFEAGVVEAGKPAAGGAWVVLPVGAEEEELEAPINSPGPISGLSIVHRCEDDREEIMQRRIPTTGGLRIIRIPFILQLAFNVSSCQGI